MIHLLTARGTGCGNGLLVPSKLSYVAFQLHPGKKKVNIWIRFRAYCHQEWCNQFAKHCIKESFNQEGLYSHCFTYKIKKKNSRRSLQISVSCQWTD